MSPHAAIPQYSFLTFVFLLPHLENFFGSFIDCIANSERSAFGAIIADYLNVAAIIKDERQDSFIISINVQFYACFARIVTHFIYCVKVIICVFSAPIHHSVTFYAIKVYIFTAAAQIVHLYVFVAFHSRLKIVLFVIQRTNVGLIRAV
jgi:hypothetical protein